MDVITTHVNADFDALASMMAAKRLYPEGRLVFPGSQEKSLRDFFLQSTYYALEVERLKAIPLDKVTRLILVDTKNPSRIGKFAELVGRPGVAIHVYDHHPFTDDDIHGEVEIIAPVGATATLMTELLRERDLEVDGTEATLLALGIYEETGSLTFTTTTPRDMEAVAYLLRCGANLNVVADFVVRDLDAAQVSLLNDLLQGAEEHVVHGVPVTVATASRTQYVADLALIVHKMRDIQNLDALIVLVRMEGRVHLVARSRIPEVDVGRVAEAFGGGGHATAASASIRDMTLIQAREKLLTFLQGQVHPRYTARDILTTPVITIQDRRTLQEAGDLMTRYGVNVFPVLEGERFQGLITRETVQQALFHELGRSPVRDFMVTEVHCATSDTPMKKIEEDMIEYNQRFMPVLEGDRVVGAITRTDLLRAMHEHLARARGRFLEARSEPKSLRRDVANLVAERLPARLVAILRKVGHLAEDMQYRAYLVGGIVRDILLGRENLDVDIVVEGDGIAFAQRITQVFPGRVRSHRAFGTAVVILEEGYKLDIATARTEYYETAAALPTVELSSIKKDLYRRDFTINALAIRLNPRKYGHLLDFFGGQRDLKDRVIRILHNLSFVEDPTRAFRAIRFEQRYGFSIGRQTADLIRSAVKMQLFEKLSGGRLFGELRLLFSEAEPVRTLARLADFDLLRFIHPKLKWTRERIGLVEAVRETLAWYRLLYRKETVEPWTVYLMALMDSLTDREAKNLCNRLAIADRWRNILLEPRPQVRKVLQTRQRAPRMPNSQVYALLKPLPLPVVLFLMAKAGETVRPRISHYLTHLQDMKPALTGRDLKALELKPGPQYRTLLQAVLEARLNGEVKTKREESALVKQMLGETR